MSNWISVKDHSPTPGERVIATDGIFVGEAYMDNKNIFHRHHGVRWHDALRRDVTHWQPMPERGKAKGAL